MVTENAEYFDGFAAMASTSDDMIGQQAYDFIIAWKTDEGTASTAHSNFEYVDWATQSNNDSAAYERLKFDSDTSGAAAVFATVRSGAARRNQEI